MIIKNADQRQGLKRQLAGTLRSLMITARCASVGTVQLCGLYRPFACFLLVKCYFSIQLTPNTQDRYSCFYRIVQ